MTAKALRGGIAPDYDVFDAASWSSIAVLSESSVADRRHHCPDASRTSREPVWFGHLLDGSRGHDRKHLAAVAAVLGVARGTHRLGNAGRGSPEVSACSHPASPGAARDLAIGSRGSPDSFPNPATKDHRRWKSLLTVLLLGWLACLVVQAAETRAGVAATDITPPLGIPMAGYYHARGADGVRDPLFAKAIVLESAGERVALVTLDIISVTRAITDQARAAIEQATGIPGAHVMISATHAHTGPELANRGQRSSDLGGQSQLAVDYTEDLPAKIAESVRLANANLQPALLSAAKGRCDNLTFNRRFFMRDGTVGWNPGKLNPDRVMPAGPTDPEVGVLYLAPVGADDPRQAVAAYVNFAMHPDTCGGSKISADWPGALSRVLAGYHGPNHLTLVGNGTCGNLNHLDFSWSWPQNTGAEGNRIGTILGAAVFHAYKDLKPIDPGTLQARSTVVELALPDVTPAQVEAAKQVIAGTKDDAGANFMKLVRSYRALDVAGRAGKPFRVEVQVIALGSDVAWVSLPGEVFVELGLAIKQRSPFAHTFVVELANENIGYIPDRRSYAEGNYEPESARCAAGSGEQLVEAAVQLLEELHP